MTEKDRDRWQTPDHILDFVRDLFHGPIEMDPATSKDNPTRAEVFWTIEDDGLVMPWGQNHVFCNPPFSKLKPFAERMSQVSSGVFIGTYSVEAAWAFRLYLNGFKLCIPKQRIRFKAPPGIEDPKQPYPTSLWIRGYHAADIKNAWGRHHDYPTAVYQPT